MNLRVILHDDEGTLWALGSQWEALWDEGVTRVPFLKPTWAQTWWRHYGQGFGLRLLCVWEEDRLVGLAPLCRPRANGGPLQWLGGEELCDALDFLIWRGKEGPVLSAMADALKPLVARENGADLHFIPGDSPTLGEASGLLQGDWDVEVTLEEASPTVTLPSSWEAFLGGLPGKDRHELRRKLRKAEKDLRPTLRVLKDEEGWEGGVGDFFRLHRISQVQKTLFMTPEREAFFAEVGRVLVREGGVRLSLLDVGGRPIAASISFVYGDTWGLYNSGYDPEYRAYSPGIVLVARTLQRAIGEGVRVYDFLRGREGYKYRFGARDRDLFRLEFAPRERRA